MRFLLAFVAVATLSAGAARADLRGVYAQGQAGLAHDAGLGVRAGAHITFVEAYVDRTQHFSGSGVTRIVGGFVLSLPLGIVRIAGRAGAGYVKDDDGGLDGDEMHGPRSGFVGRVGGAVELPAGKLVSIGALLEQEYFSVRSGEDTGTGTMASVYLKIGLGL